MVSKIEVTRQLLPASPKRHGDGRVVESSRWKWGPLAHRGHRGDCLGRLILSQRGTGGISNPLTTCGQSRGDCRSSRPSGKAVVCILPSPLAATVSTSIARAKQLPATSHDSPGSPSTGLSASNSPSGLLFSKFTWIFPGPHFHVASDPQF